jgi:hypothetical protein
MNNPDPMAECEQSGELAFDHREAARLDLNQQVLADEIDHEAVDRNFDSIALSEVPLFEGGVQRLFA